MLRNSYFMAVFQGIWIQTGLKQDSKQRKHTRSISKLKWTTYYKNIEGVQGVGQGTQLGVAALSFIPSVYQRIALD